VSWFYALLVGLPFGFLLLTQVPVPPLPGMDVDYPALTALFVRGQLASTDWTEMVIAAVGPVAGAVALSWARHRAGVRGAPLAGWALVGFNGVYVMLLAPRFVLGLAETVLYAAVPVALSVAVAVTGRRGLLEQAMLAAWTATLTIKTAVFAGVVVLLARRSDPSAVVLPLAVSALAIGLVAVLGRGRTTLFGGRSATTLFAAVAWVAASLGFTGLFWIRDSVHGNPDEKTCAAVDPRARLVDRALHDGYAQYYDPRRDELWAFSKEGMVGVFSGGDLAPLARLDLGSGDGCSKASNFEVDVEGRALFIPCRQRVVKVDLATRAVVARSALFTEDQNDRFGLREALGLAWAPPEAGPGAAPGPTLLVSFVQHPALYQLDPETLAVKGVVKYFDRLRSNVTPHLVPDRGAVGGLSLVTSEINGTWTRYDARYHPVEQLRPRWHMALTRSQYDPVTGTMYSADGVANLLEGVRVGPLRRVAAWSMRPGMYDLTLSPELRRIATGHLFEGVVQFHDIDRHAALPASTDVYVGPRPRRGVFIPKTRTLIMGSACGLFAIPVP